MKDTLSISTQELSRSHTLIINKIVAIAKNLECRGINTQATSLDSLEKFKKLEDTESLAKIYQNFEIIEEVLSSTPLPQSGFENEEPYENEIKRAKKALSILGMRVEDECWTCLESNDVIEIYGTDMIQKYRSFNFYKNSGYSLLDLILNEWYVLWQRPTSILNTLMASAQEILNGNRSIIKTASNNHLVLEIFDTGNTKPFEPSALNVNIKYIVPAFKSVGHELIGFIVISSCAVEMVGKDVDGIALI
jgi:hypothetical protein